MPKNPMNEEDTVTAIRIIAFAALDLPSFSAQDVYRFRNALGWIKDIAEKYEARKVAK